MAHTMTDNGRSSQDHGEYKPTSDFAESGPPAPGEAIDHETMVQLAAEYVPGSEAEKKLLRKLDFRIIASAK